ncbi:MAG: serine/threonine protein kinase [Gammaproteobacteria bacterium]|nr:serine/threonine protein kinase [Gammaproteobacteria bacterium]
MASVYLAIQESLGRAVVLKVLDISKKTGSDDLIERFLAEGRIVASLSHPNIITIFDIGIAGDNLLYISMEYIQGGDLKTRIGIPFEPKRALDYLIKIGNGLSAAHKYGVVHRDVKPANILFRDDDTPLLTDFGIAKQVNEDLNLTSTGIFLGSPNYVSPEQADGSEIDGRADIYSLGCIFYEMLTGEKPYPSETVFDVVIRHKQAPIPALPEDLQAFQPLLEKMMAKNRNDRFENADSMVEHIIDLQRRTPSLSTVLDFDVTSPKTGVQKSKRKFIVLMILLFLSASFFTALQFVEIRIKGASVSLDEVPLTTSVAVQAPVNKPMNTGTTIDLTNSATVAEPVSDEVINALVWLGKRSLEEYRLTDPPKDNAYYYFSRLLEINPADKTARAGLLEIANRYAILAERAMANNEYEKTEAYINIGLKINPGNETLLSLKSLGEEIGQKSFMDTLKSLYNGK